MEIYRSASGLVGRMVGENGGYCETSAKGTGAVKTRRGTVEHHLNQHWSRSQLETHHSRWGFHSTVSRALPNWRTRHNTHGTRAYNEVESDQGASIKAKTVWRRLETVDKRIFTRAEKFPRSPTSSREDFSTPPRRRRPNTRGRSPQTAVGTGTHRGVAEGAGRPSEDGGAPDEWWPPNYTLHTAGHPPWMLTRGGRMLGIHKDLLADLGGGWSTCSKVIKVYSFHSYVRQT